MKTLFLALLAACLDAACTGSEPIAAAIPSVQGDGPASPCEGRVVTVTGVVTAAFPGLSGFFLQDPAGDGDAATSDAIFVFRGSGPLPPAGSVARVTGRVAEFRRQGYDGSVTELDIRAAGGPAAGVEILGADSLPAPIPLDPGLDGDAAAYLETHEGVLVEYPGSAVVGPANRFGEFFALRYDRAPRGVRPTADEPGAGRPLLIDTAGGAVRRDPTIFDLVPPLTGPLHFDFGAYRLEPLAAYAVSSAGWTPVSAPPPAPGALTIASMNLERLVREDLTAAALEAKLDQVSAAIRGRLGSPGLIGIQEIGGLPLLQTLAARSGNYQAVLLKGCDFSGIDSGLLYDASRIRVISQSQLQTEAPQFRKGPCTLPDGRSFSQILFDRPPLRVDLTIDGVPATIVVNHWRSQIGGREDQRIAGARFLTSELAAVENLIVAGDFNDAETSASLAALTGGTGLLNLTSLVPARSRYSLVFEGRSSAYDHILVSPSLARRVAAAGFVHHNADFPASRRFSDHDNPFAQITP